MRDLWRAWDSFAAALGRGRRILLLLDYDGTLAPIQVRPERAMMPAATRSALDRMARSKRFRIAVISGRSLKDLKRMVGLPGVIYVGNHGLEWEGPGLRTPEGAREALRILRTAERVAPTLREAFAELAPVWVEDKEYTLSVHYRDLPRERLRRFREVLSILRTRHRDWPVEWRQGKKVIEIRPKTHWHKGEAVRHLAARYPEDQQIAIGDDLTDQDMFDAVRPRGVSVQVGRHRRARADYWIGSPREVRRLLEKLCP